MNWVEMRMRRRSGYDVRDGLIKRTREGEDPGWLFQGYLSKALQLQEKGEREVKCNRERLAT